MSKAKNLPHDDSGNGPRIIMYIDKKAKARHRAFVQIAKTLREEAEQPIQKNIRTGRTDFLLRIRRRGDETP